MQCAHVGGKQLSSSHALWQESGHWLKGSSSHPTATIWNTTEMPRGQPRIGWLFKHGWLSGGGGTLASTVSSSQHPGFCDLFPLCSTPSFLSGGEISPFPHSARHTQCPPSAEASHRSPAGAGTAVHGIGSALLVAPDLGSMWSPHGTPRGSRSAQGSAAH